MNAQLELGLSLKQRGQNRAAKAASEWHELAYDWISSQQGSFSADDLIAGVGLPNPSQSNRNNAVGAVFTAARKAKVITRVGWTQSTRPEGHGRVIALWAAN